MTALLSFWLWPFWVWPWIGGSAAVLAEFWFRLYPTTPYYRQWVPLLLAIPINYAVFRVFSASATWLGGFVAFSSVTLLVRIVLSVAVLGESLTWRAILGVGLLMVARGLVR